MNIKLINMYGGKAQVAFSTLMSAADALSSRIHTHASAHGLSVSQFGVLAALMNGGPMSQSQIGVAISKTSGNVTLVIDNLEKRGLARRGADPSDRRRHVVEMTAQGRRLMEKLMPEHARSVKAQMGMLESSELEELARLCNKLDPAQKGES